ncbi:hypothetical protein NZK35_11025 [Stieleria sp. ICT_E10.1]|uniref:hypothetical protein n=1 Tax=Stieleria sedimenti TaxID=2976331 RepID=UPI000BDC9833|nr:MULTISPECIES: hypothetical protein [Pirellulaceae]MCS7467175.1 hypothetical protein [Stieleria sedimenti]PAY18224.1 hypothetical protein CKO51_17410 [Rhodopirellula sp. SM50]
MSGKSTTRRASFRRQKAFPVGTLIALLTAVAVTLVGVILGLESSTILMRAIVSSVLVGSVVSIGVGVIRLADADYKD